LGDCVALGSLTLLRYWAQENQRRRADRQERRSAQQARIYWRTCSTCHVSKLPDEILVELCMPLTVSGYVACLCVSKRWYDNVGQEMHWQRLCRLRWPCAVPLSGGTWQKFVLSGGGLKLGEALLWTLKRIIIMEVEARDDLVAAAACLLHHGAQNCGDADGWTSLHYACRVGLTSIVERLLDQGADIECKDALHGYTPLMVGATHGHKEVVQGLLRRGAVKSTLSKHGRNATDCARLWGRADVEGILEV